MNIIGFEIFHFYTITWKGAKSVSELALLFCSLVFLLYTYCYTDFLYQKILGKIIATPESAKHVRVILRSILCPPMIATASSGIVPYCCFKQTQKPIGNRMSSRPTIITAIFISSERLAQLYFWSGCFCAIKHKRSNGKISAGAIC